MKAFLFLVSIIAVCYGQDKCAQMKKFCADPTYCWTDKCDSLQSSANDQDFKNGMVKAHNEYRKINFKGFFGADMLEMVWSDELADTAMKNAVKMCASASGSMKHDDCRASPNYSSVGQNIAWGAGSSWKGKIDPNATAVSLWYNEISQATADQIDPFKYTAPTGHFTQVMWSRSCELGCAYVTKTHQYGAQGWVVCNYAVAGNLIGSYMFKKGPLASQCPNGSSKGACGLCCINNKDQVRAAVGIQKVPA